MQWLAARGKEAESGKNMYKHNQDFPSREETFLLSLHLPPSCKHHIHPGRLPHTADSPS